MNRDQERPPDNPHAIRYAALPERWTEGLPLGNGELAIPWT